MFPIKIFSKTDLQYVQYVLYCICQEVTGNAYDNKRGGEGSHRKFEKANYPRPVILPSHSKELSRRVENSVGKAVAYKVHCIREKEGPVMKKVYAAIFEKDPVGYGIYFPDVEGAVTQARSISEGLENASDALGIMLGSLIENNMPLPEPTAIKDLSVDAETEFATLIAVDLNDYLKDVKLDKKTIKIPHWLNVRATKDGVNFSRTMAEALEEKLNI